MQIDAPAPATLVRQLQPDDVKCPAGSCIGEAGVQCGIELGVLDGRTDTFSVTRFCMAEYTECPSWRAERERIAAGKIAKLTDRPKGPSPKAAKEQRLREARERMLSDTPEGRRIRSMFGMNV